MKLQGRIKDPVAERLDRIGKTLDDLLVIECARMGMTKAEVKSIVGGDSNRITRIWKHIKNASTDSET